MYLGKRGLLLVMIVLLLIGGISLFSFQNRLTGLAVFTENMDVPEETSAPEEVTPAAIPLPTSIIVQTNLANTTQCGYVNNSITLTSDVTANATCFNINVSHVILNCNGFNINYSITGVPGSAINISNENNITVQNCNIYEKNATNDQKPAIRLINVTNSSFQSNVITTLGNASYGLYVINSTLNNFYDNRIITVNESAYGIYLVNDSQNNTFTDNNISARAAFEILDETGDDYVNLFVYNNSFGEIKWMNNGSMGFLHNLTFNITNDKGVSLNFNLFIGENVIAVNTSAFSPLRMNSTANITLRKLSFNKDVTVIKRMENFTVDAAEIRAAGTNCNGTSCAILNYSNTTGDLFFNTTYFSSFTAEGNVSCGEINRNTTLTRDVNGTSPPGSSCFTLASNNIFLDCVKYKIFGNNSATGIEISGQSLGKGNFTIQNCRIANFGKAISSTGMQTVIINNTITNSTTLGVELRTLEVDTDIEPIFNNKIINNRFSYNNETAILFASVIQSYIINNTLEYNREGILFTFDDSTDEPSSSLIIQSNNFSHNRLYAVYMGGYNNTFRENFLWNNTLGYNLVGTGNSTDNRFYNEKIINHASAILINNSELSYDNTFRHSTFVDNIFDLNITAGSTVNITFVNTSINKNKMHVAITRYAYVKSFIYVNITDSSGNPLSGATSKAYNSIGTKVDENNTDSNGLGTLEVIEFFRENNINYVVTPSTFKVTKNNYTSNTTSLNLLNVTSAQINLSIGPVGCGDIITSDFSFGNNYNCAGDGIIIGARDISIEGNNYNLSGQFSGVGISISNYSNISISNLQIQNFTRGINFENANISTATNVKIINDTIGVYFSNSYNNKIYNSLLLNNTNISVYSVGNGVNNSIINSTIYNPRGNITAMDSSEVNIKQFVHANASLNGWNPLASATFYGYYNGTYNVDHSKTTPSNGIARLELTEIKFNKSGAFSIPPHNISLVFVYLGANITNSTVINITGKTDIQVNLSLILNCTVPTSGLSITADTTFCPGEFDVENISVSSSGVTLTCINTILQGPDNYVELFTKGVTFNRNNSKILDCTLKKYYYAIQLSKISQPVLSNITITNNHVSDSGFGVFLIFSSNTNITSLSTEVRSGGIELYDSSNNYILKNNFSGGTSGLQVEGASNNNFIYNNTFRMNKRGISLNPLSLYPPANNTIYHNNFSSITTNNYEYYTDSDHPNYFNTTVGNLTQGNSYSDYCDKGRDTNGDDYADASSTGAVDWPYNSSVSSKIYESGGQVVDYGPKIISCPPTTQFLGSAAAAAAAAAKASASGSGPAAAPPPAAPPPPPAPSVGSSSPAEAAQFLQIPQLVTSRLAENIIQITVSLENTGTKTMQLFPQLLQDIDDPFFIVTRKTLGAEGSFAEKASSLAYSKASVAGRLLKAEILNPEQIILQPGEKIEKTLQIKEGLAIPRQIKIQFTTLGEAVKEQEFKVEKKAFSGTAIDLDTEQNTMDMYAIFVPEELTQKLEQAYAGGGITGAAVVQPAEQGEYLLELSLDKKEIPKMKKRFPFRFLMLPSRESAFADLYGPYKLKEGQSFIFAQQFKYDPKVYTGEYEIRTKIYRDNNVLVENQFPVTLGAELPPEQQVPLVLPQPVEEALSLVKRSYQILGLWIVPAVLVFLSILVGGFVFIRRH